MKKLTDINVVKNIDAITIELIIEFDGNYSFGEIISPVMESPLGVARRLEHLADMIRHHENKNHTENE